MIQTIQRHAGRPSALCVCDDCATEREVACDYELTAGRKWIPNEGQIIRKITGQGWSHMRGRLRCPECEAKRKTLKENSMAENVAPIRQPTREQIREIIQMLDVVYDSKAGRYTGGETDQTVAKSMGNGIMPGWVAAERERAFGPAGGNEEIDALTAEVEGYRDRVTALERAVAEELKGLDALLKRLTVIKDAVGVKVARA